MDNDVSDILDKEAGGKEAVLKKAFKHKSFEERMAEYNNRIHVENCDWGEPLGKEMVCRVFEYDQYNKES